MCDHHTPPPATPRHGSSLEHGAAHSDDHRRWSRRDFLTSMGLTAAGGAILLGQTPMRAFGQTPLLAHLRTLETDRVLVLIQLNGGNDGLNTVIPAEDDLYFNARPQLAIPKAEALVFDNSVDMRLHPSFDAVTPLYGDGQMAVLQNVGYPAPSLSHFSSTDIWLSASSSADIAATGWLGRYLDQDFPDFEQEAPSFPLAVQMGGLSSMLFQGPTANMGMSLASPDLFERIAETGLVFDEQNLPATTYGEEMLFVRQVANDSFQYASAVQEASQQGINRVEYPGSPLAQNLSIVAQLIKGQLGARIYHVSIGSFDTHALQLGTQANLLRQLNEAVKAFTDDLALDGLTDDVLIMTFSEFGRRVNQNGSQGTDHGTAAPLFLFGGGVEGGFYGPEPALDDLDETGNLKFDIDFRAVYATILQDWFGMDATTVSTVLGGTFDPLGFVADPATPTANEDPQEVPQTFTLHQNYPNPFNPTTTISFTLARTEQIRLRLFDVQGRLIQTLYDGLQTAGTHALAFDAGHLASGTYFYRLETQEGLQTRTMALVR